MDLRKEGVEIPHLLGDLSWNLIGPHRMFVRLLPEAEVEPNEREREGNPNPQTQENQHGRERDSSRRVYPPDEEI